MLAPGLKSPTESWILVTAATESLRKVSTCPEVKTEINNTRSDTIVFIASTLQSRINHHKAANVPEYREFLMPRIQLLLSSKICDAEEY